MIDHTKVPNTDQNGFPVLISGTYSYLAAVASGGKVTNANGYDIAFYADAAGATPLSWEIEKYSATDGAAGFSGSGNITIPDAEGLRITSAFTVELWVYEPSDQNPWAYIIDKWDYSAGDYRVPIPKV